MGMSPELRVWSFLEDHDVHQPVDDLKEFIRDLGYMVSTYAAAVDLIREMDLEDWCHTKKGFSVKIGDQGYIFYAGGLPLAQIQQILLHELGHLVLHHPYGGRGQDEPADEQLLALQEKEADIFVYEFIPTPVLYRAGYRTFEQIRHLTGLEDDVVEHIVARVAAYAQSERWGAEEEAVCRQFAPFITPLTTKPARWPRVRAYLWRVGLVAVIVTAMALLTQSLLGRIQPAASTPRVTADPPSGVTTSMPPTSSTLSTTLSPMVAGDGVVYVTTQGRKYHQGDCHTIAGSSLIALSLEEAQAAGYEPCAICYPHDGG